MPVFSICLIILEISQGFEHASCIKNAGVLNMLRYSCNNIIIVTNIVILELLYAGSVHRKQIFYTLVINLASLLRNFFMN